jgi:hypothetical protein
MPRRAKLKFVDPEHKGKKPGADERYEFVCGAVLK